MSFQIFSVSVCNKCCNQVADRLATYGADLSAADEDVFMDHAPNFVIVLVSGDEP
jgi:hypothetical protein